jgi:molybdate transport system ATP-binding protein
MILKFENATINWHQIPVLSHINWEINELENWAIVGATGSGKTILAESIAGNILLSDGKLHFGSSQRPLAKVVNFNQIHTLPNSSQFYYQQRFNSTDSDTGPLVSEYLGGYESVQLIKDFIDTFQLEHLLSKRLVHLSNGENKKVLLAKSLLQKPDILILDYPLIGLDKESRLEFLYFADHLISKGQKVIFIGEPHELPQAITHIIKLGNGTVSFQGKKENLKNPTSNKATHNFDIKALPAQSETFQDFKDAVRMVDIHVQYGKHLILDKLNWKVEKGSKWVLRGPNGSGKSTLLSLITGDNPQVYANEVWLFDRKRGTGESIWDIKKKIGFMSPELQVYADHRGSCLDVACSGFVDGIGIKFDPTTLQKSIAEAYFKAFAIDHLSQKPFREVSTGEQRLVLLARALVKNPPLLILDEPCQGLDTEKTESFNQLIDYICQKETKTLIYVSHYASQIPSCVDKELILGQH